MLRTGLMLEALGITEVEETGYRLLLGRGECSPAELARLTGLSSRESRVVLDGLAEKGLIARLPGRAIRFRPVEPAVAVEGLFLRRQQSLEQARMSVAALQDEFRRHGSRGRLVDLVEVVSGRAATAERAVHIQRAATREIVMFDKPPYVSVEPGTNPVELELLGRGIRYRGLYSHASLDLPGVPTRLAVLQAAGEQARVVADVPLKLLMADETIALIPQSLDEPGMEEGALVVHSSSLLRALSTLYEDLWERAAPLNLEAPTRGTPSSGLPPECEQPLALLVAGLKDQAIGRQLGISPATVDRRVRRIMQILGARTRFQAGVLATRRGWLP